MTTFSAAPRAVLLISLQAALLSWACVVLPAHAADVKPAAQADASAKQEPKAPASAVTVKLSQHLVTAENGAEKLVEVKYVKPGDVIEYRARYTNSSAKPVTSLVATLPVHENLEYMAGTAKPTKPAVQAATKDLKYGPEPLMTTPEGAGKPVPVPYSEYRSLRWTVGTLPASGVFEAVARMRVSSSTPLQPLSFADLPSATGGGAVQASGSAKP